RDRRPRRRRARPPPRRSRARPPDERHLLHGPPPPPPAAPPGPLTPGLAPTEPAPSRACAPIAPWACTWRTSWQLWPVTLELVRRSHAGRAPGAQAGSVRRSPADLAVDHLADQVGVAVVAGVLLDHVRVDPAQGALLAAAVQAGVVEGAVGRDL